MSTLEQELDSALDAMGRRARKWPHIYKRTYNTGREVYVVDLGLQNGKRQRRTFATMAEAETFGQQARVARQNSGAVAFSLPPEELTQAALLYKDLLPHGISLATVRNFYLKEVIPFLTAPTIAEMVDQLMSAGCKSEWRPSTARTYRQFFGLFVPVFGHRQIKDLKLQELQDFCTRDGLSPRTKLNNRRIVSYLFNFAMSRRWTDRNIAHDIVVPRKEDKEPAIFAVEQVKCIIQHADEFGLLGYVALGLFAGIRPREIQRMDWSDVSLEDGEIYVRPCVSKIGRKRAVPINDTLRAWLALCHRARGPIVPGNFPSRLKALRRAAGLKRWPQDGMRHSYATYHVTAYECPEKTAYYMGHVAGLQMLYTYYKGLVSKAEAEKFWAIRPPVPRETESSGK